MGRWDNLKSGVTANYSGVKKPVEKKQSTPVKKPSKYRSQKTEVDGIVFDSKREAARWGVLKLLEKNGEIKDLRRQIPFKWNLFAAPVDYRHGPMEEYAHKVGKVRSYVADFVYVVVKTGQQVVEDAKGMRLPTYREKKKIVKALFGVDIIEV